MTSVQVRPAAKEDIGALCAMYYDFHEFHVAGVPHHLASLRGSGPEERARLAERLQELMDAKDSEVFVAEQGHEIVGLAEVYLREDDRSPARIWHCYGYLQSMFVCHEHRRTGVGRKLLDAAETWARVRGATEMRLDTWEFAQGPLGFYERSGYRTLRRTLVRNLV